MNYSEMRLRLGDKVAIVGLGKSGLAAQNLLSSAGYSPDSLLLFDDKDSGAQFNDPLKLMAENPTALVVSPGYPLRKPWLKEAAKRGLCITSEVELAFAFLTDEVRIAVTGSVGKSTVCALLRAGCLGDDPMCFLGGNFGNPLATYVVDTYLKKTRNKAKYLILELSSYQLENFPSLSVDYSIITSLLPNHLERYDSLQDYYDTKLKLLTSTKKQAVLNKSGGDLLKQKLAQTNKLFWVDRWDLKSLLPASDEIIKLVGDHNRDNLCLALKALALAGVSEKSSRQCLSFPGLEHRLENLGSIRGAICINDSKATTVDSVLVAVQGSMRSFPAQRITVLLGGRDKNLPWVQLAALKSVPELDFVFFGECGEAISKLSGLVGPYFPRLRMALDYFFAQTNLNGRVLLLSPGGTSLDEFKSFEDRGHFFKNYLKDKAQN